MLEMLNEQSIDTNFLTFFQNMKFYILTGNGRTEHRQKKIYKKIR